MNDELKENSVEREPVPKNWKPLIYLVSFLAALTAAIALAAAMTNLFIYPEL